jgi:hypothetical protein
LANPEEFTEILINDRTPAEHPNHPLVSKIAIKLEDKFLIKDK